MKDRPDLSNSPTGSGNHSRHAARYFLSRAWLDRPLPAADKPRRAHLTIRLESVLRKPA